MFFNTKISFFPRNKHNIDHATSHIIAILSQSTMLSPLVVTSLLVKFMWVVKMENLFFIHYIGI